MKCPSCSTEKLSNSSGESKPYNCSQCDGFWLTGESLASICSDNGLDIALLRVQLREKTENNDSKICPICVQNLRTSKVSDVELDWCAGCEGIWFDRGEFDKVVDDVNKIPRSEIVVNTIAIADILMSIFFE